MQNVAGHALELTAKDVEAYWRGRAYIEAARIAHNHQEDPTAYTLTFQFIEPYLPQGWEVVNPIREQHEGELPDAVFEPGETLEPRFVVMLALMIDSDKTQVGGKTIKSMAHLSSVARDKRIVLVLNGHDTALARHLALEAGYEVSEAGLIDMAKAVGDKAMRRAEHTGFFELDTPRERKERDPNLDAVRHKHNRVGRHSGNQRFNAKPQRQNFKGRGR